MSKLEVGYVARAHGVRGELRVHTHDPQSTSLYDVKQLWIGGEPRRVRGVRETSGALLVRVEGVDDKDAADALKGKPVEIDRADVALGEGEFLIADLPGCTVVTEAGAALGVIAEVIHGGQDLLVIHDTAAHVERLLPLVPAFVVSVDVAEKRVVVAPPEDLPEEKLR